MYIKANLTDNIKGWCKTIKTTLFYVTSYYSFKSRPRYALKLTYFTTD